MARQWYGSLTNRLYEKSKQAEPEVGQGATLTSYTDRRAGTIIEVFKKGRSEFLTVQLDTVERKDKNGMSESQDYEYTPNPTGAKYTFRRNEKSKGQWQEVRLQENGRYKVYGGYGLLIGFRDEYYDYSF